MISKQLPSVRRIVTGVNETGRSYIAQDGASPTVLTVEGRPGYQNNNMWRTLGGEHKVDAPDTIVDHKGLLPPQGGTVLRVIDIPPEPEDLAERRRQTEALFSKMFADAVHHAEDSRAPGMHTTDTVDYAILLHGELVAVLDEDEAVMKAGDVLIQRGTSHAWVNRSGEVARIAFILVDAKR